MTNQRTRRTVFGNFSRRGPDSPQLWLAWLVAASIFIGAPPATVHSGPPDTPSQQTSRVDGDALRSALAKLEKRAEAWGATVGVTVMDIGDGRVLAEKHADRPLNPASNAKLFTAAAALDRLGPQHRFATGLYGRLKDGRVDDLVLRGQGDPSLSTTDMFELARDLHAAGVRRVKNIAVDQSYFDDDYVPPAFDQQPDEWAAFRAPVAAVSLNANTLLFTIRATEDGRAARVTVEPPGFATVTGSVRTGEAGSKENIQLGLSPTEDGRLQAKLGGKIPAGSRLVRFAKRVDDPRLLAGYALRWAIEASDIRVEGHVQLGGQSQKRLLTRHRSEPLGRLVWALGKDSNNFAAEMLFKAVGAAEEGPDAQAASAAVRGFLRERKVLDEGMKVVNGSGLFDSNLATTSAIARLLRSVYRDPAIRPEFLSQLSVGGVDGTLRSRFPKWREARAIRAKTGTLASVVSLSGYVLGPEGRRSVVFSIVFNGVGGKITASRKAADAFVAALAKEVYASQ